MATRKPVAVKPPKGIPAKIWTEFVGNQGAGDPEAAIRSAAAEQLLGRPLPPDLRVIGWVDPEAGTIFPRPVAELLASANSFEHLLDSAGRGNPEPIAHFLAGCHYLRDDGDSGDAFFFALPPEDDVPCEVVLWSCEAGSFSYCLASDLASFEAGVEPNPRRKSTAPWAERQVRSRWLAWALAGERLWQTSWPDPQDDESFDPAVEDPRFPRDVPEALYWLWRTVLLAQDARARRAIERLVDSPARLLRDAATVAAEVLDGRVELGPIADVQALQRRMAEIIADPDAVAARDVVELEAEALERLAAALPTGVSVVQLAELPSVPSSRRSPLAMVRMVGG